MPKNHENTKNISFFLSTLQKEPSNDSANRCISKMSIYNNRGVYVSGRNNNHSMYRGAPATRAMYDCLDTLLISYGEVKI